MMKFLYKYLMFMYVTFLFQSCNIIDGNKEVDDNELIRPATTEEAKNAISGKWQLIASGPEQKGYEQFWNYQDFDSNGGYMELLPDGTIRYFNPETGEFGEADGTEELSYVYATYKIDTKYLYLYLHRNFVDESSDSGWWSYEYQLTKNQLRLHMVGGKMILSMGAPRIFIYQLIK